MFPYCREVSFRVGQVEEVGEVLGAQGTKMLELVNGESICAGCSGVGAGTNSIMNLGGGKRCCMVVKTTVFVYLADEFFGCTVVGVGYRSRELFHELVGNHTAVGVNLPIEGYRLVRVLVSAFSG